jgi:hypothetical protein
MIVIKQDMIDVNSVIVSFKKKAKPWFGSDPNAGSFSFEKLKFTNVEIDESYAECDKLSVSDGKTVDVGIAVGDCSVKSSSMLLRMLGFSK